MSGDVYSFSDKFLSVNSIANIENAVNLVSRTKPEYLIINHLLEDKKRVDHFRVSSDLIEYLNIVYGLSCYSSCSCWFCSSNGVLVTIVAIVAAVVLALDLFFNFFNILYQNGS
jgi:hypothetical protein